MIAIQRCISLLPICMKMPADCSKWWNVWCRAVFVAGGLSFILTRDYFYPPPSCMLLYTVDMDYTLRPRVSWPVRRRLVNIGGWTVNSSLLSFPLPSFPFPSLPLFPFILSFHLPSHSIPSPPFLRPQLPNTATGSGGALKLPQRVRAEPGRQTLSDAF